MVTLGNCFEIDYPHIFVLVFLIGINTTFLFIEPKVVSWVHLFSLQYLHLYFLVDRE